MEITRRQKSIIKRMCNHVEFYSSYAPKITRKEIVELNKMGFIIQTASPIDEATYHSPANRDAFVKKAAELGIIPHTATE